MFNKILEPNVKFEIPIYQRTYDWSKKHCRQLYDDIVKVGKSDEDISHFIGAITYVSETTLPNVDVESYQVIDGQQRLTTIMLLLRALKDVLDGTSGNVTKPKIDQLLFNINEKVNNPNYYKLILTEDDNPIFQEIMKDGKSESSNNIVINFKYFTTWLSEDNNAPDVIWRGIRRLNLVQILINEKDDAQAIFESMNSTGLDLSSTDMIQSYLLMSKKTEWQERIYKNYWRTMEKRFGDPERFADFLRDYLMMHRGSIVSKKDTYEYFKKHMVNLDKEDEIKKMYKYSEYHANLVKLSEHPSEKLNKVIKYVYDQDTRVANPLLLKLLADYADGNITECEAESVFLLVDSYLLRCHICDMTKGGNKVFPETIPHIDKNNYAKSIEKTLMSKMGNRRFPRDIIFKEKLEQLPIYMNRTMCKYLLVRLEHEHKELIDVENIEIEHIMPQKLNDDWKNDLGEDWKNLHEKYIHIIGNLTLTAYNAHMSNERFPFKIETFKQSNISLTRDLTEYSKWNEDTIKKRTKMLTEKAVKLWACPKGYDLESTDDRLSEDEYLDGKNIKELWKTLKEKILSACIGIEFYMWKTYGSFKLHVADSKDIVICSMEAQNNKIILRYNTKIQDGVINSSKFVRDVSNIGHYGVGDFCSMITFEEDVDRGVNLTKTIYEYKSKNPK